ncbi:MULTISPECIES: ATP-binding protein [unclassified Mesorhizobium]|uniref:ATP-binding protein n=1 Tax=unclassified Mesorhizobium TaxID=325217 RepID=UPI00112855BB|nr:MULTISPECIES: ATP-binding protein [unclassified Mesorhizobium]TPK90105.1 two-component sensor histidine kinase [Mesorhizobium sp. B2-4-16]TPL58040.1 two-component sensor histidine kinase [Mesorhizobium sp. B2-4-3]
MSLGYHRLRLWFRGSLRRRLLLWLLPATLLAGILASIGTYWGAFLELGDLLDEQMRYVAEHVDVANANRVSPTDDGKRQRQDNDEKADEVLLEVWRDGRLDFTTDAALTLPPPQRPGLSDVSFNGQTWHTFVDQRGDRLIRVGQAQNARWEALAGLSVHLFWPVLSLLPLLALFLWYGIGYGLKPLYQITSELKQRDAESLAPIGPGPLPNEVKPLVDSLNDLLRRLDHAFTMQKHFIADAAHELRTPMMALSIQTQLAQTASTEEERGQALSQLQSGVIRLAHLGQQLLTLARLEPQGQAIAPRSVELSDLCKSVILDQTRLAEAKHIDLGLVTRDKAEIPGDPEALRILLNNLVDNAIRYTPAHGTVDLAVRRKGYEVVLEVCDNGPGIPEAEREQVLERFYRGSNQEGQGSGLGLSIVQRIVAQHGALLVLGSGPDGKGLLAQVLFK